MIKNEILIDNKVKQSSLSTLGEKNNNLLTEML